MQLTLLAVHPDARRQRTTTGRTLATLVWHAGRLYAGYGDYGANTGPIRLRTLSPENRYFSPPLATLPTEAVYEFRPFRGQLLVPNIDLRGRLGPAAFIGSGPHWTPSPDITSTHVFDALLVGPDEVWLLGSVGREPAVWHWRVASGRIERIPTPTRRPDAAFSRATGAFEYKGEMCVYFQQVASIGETDVQCWSGRAWQPGPTVFPDDATFADMALTRPTPFADGIVYTDTHTGVSRIPSRLYYLPTDVAEGGSTPARFRYAFGPAGQFEDAGKTAYVRDFYLDDGTLWLLNALAEVWRSNTPGAWERVGRIALPRGERAASLAVNAGRLFIGTDRAQVYEVTPHPPVDATHSSLQ